MDDLIDNFPNANRGKDYDYFTKGRKFPNKRDSNHMIPLYDETVCKSPRYHDITRNDNPFDVRHNMDTFEISRPALQSLENSFEKDMFGSYGGLKNNDCSNKYESNRHVMVETPKSHFMSIDKIMNSPTHNFRDGLINSHKYSATNKKSSSQNPGSMVVTEQQIQQMQYTAYLQQVNQQKSLKKHSASNSNSLLIGNRGNMQLPIMNPMYPSHIQNPMFDTGLETINMKPVQLTLEN
jgi:hypothetical protein